MTMFSKMRLASRLVSAFTAAAFVGIGAAAAYAAPSALETAAKEAIIVD